MLETRFSLAFRREFPDLLGHPLVAAVSGGPDSTALALLLARTGPQLGLTFAIAHVHHGVRGQEADEDAAFCERLAGALGVHFFLERLPLPPKGCSREAFWRTERYRALEAVRQRFGASAIASAHTMDDQGETVLLKLLRGSGPRGVAGIRRRLGNVVRPLLNFRRQELLDYLREKGQEFRTDSTNLLADRPRTFLRSHVIPLLIQAFPRGVEHLACFGEEIGEDDELLNRLTLREAPLALVGKGQPASRVAGLPTPLRRRWLQALAASLPLKEAPSRVQFSLFSSLLDQGEPKAVDLGARWVLSLEDHQLILKPPPIPLYSPVSVSFPGIFHLPGGFVLGIGQHVSRADHRVFLAAKVREAPLVVTPLPAGFRFQGKLVRRELARLGVPQQWRAAWPALAAGGSIVWVPGVGVLPSWAGEDGIEAELEEPWKRHGKLSPPRPLRSGLRL